MPMSGLSFGESPRWHDSRLWVADWGAQELIAVDLIGTIEVIAHVASFPFSIDWLPAGRPLIVWTHDRKLLRSESNGSLVTPDGTQRQVADGHRTGAARIIKGNCWRRSVRMTSLRPRQRHVPIWLGRLAAGEVGASIMPQMHDASNGIARRELDRHLHYSRWRADFRSGPSPGST